MARDHGRILCRIWQDKDFRALPRTTQALYMQLLSQPSVNNAGVLPLQISKWAKGCDELDEGSIADDLLALVDRGFVMVDEDTEEVLIRTFVRNDGVLAHKYIFKNALRCAEAVESPALRHALAVELRRVGRPEANAVAEILMASAPHPDVVVKASKPDPDPIEAPEPQMPSESHSNDCGKGKGKGVPNVGSNSASNEKDAKAPRKTPVRSEPKPRTTEHIVTTSAYDRVGKAFNFVAVLKLVKWAIHDRGSTPESVESAIIGLYERGKPITKQTLGQWLDGHLGRNGSPNGVSRSDEKVQNYIQMGRDMNSRKELE